MRRIVIAKMLILALWALYLGIVLSRPISNEFNDAAGVDKPDHKKSFRFSPNRKFSAAKAKTTSAAGSPYVCPADSRSIASGSEMIEA
jgi:hypothetical protein